MKFWALVILCGAAIAIGTSALSTMNPNAQRKKPAAPVAVAAVPEGPQPRVALAGPMEGTHDPVPQHHKGMDQYEIKNTGEAPLLLKAGKPSCTCTDLYFTPAKAKFEDPAPAAGAGQEIALAPGGSAFVVARWDTKDKGGPVPVAAKIYTNDPLTPELPLVVKLNIVQDLVFSPDLLALGTFDQGTGAQISLECLAPVAESVEISEVELSAPYLSAEVVPITAAELQGHGKSGQRIVVTASKEAPTGKFQEMLRFKAKVGTHEQVKTVPVQGIVFGELQIVGDAKIDFHLVDPNKAAKPQTRRLVAKREPTGGDYKLGAVGPANTVVATLQRDVKNRLLWTLSVTSKLGAPVGGIKGGKVTVLDGAGKEAAAFVVVGNVSN